MNHTRLVFLFVLCLFVKVTTLSYGAEAYALESDADAYSRQQTQVTNNNNINIGQQQGKYNEQAFEPVHVSPRYASRGYGDEEAASVLGTKYRQPYNNYAYDNRIGFMPTIGTAFMAPPGISVSNAYSLGLGLDFPMGPNFAIEAEGSYTPDARWVDNRGIPVSPPGTPPPPRPFRDFSMWTLGSNLKVYLTRYGFRPYLGGGLMARYYDGKSLPYQQAYTRWTGDAQAFLGFDWDVNPSVSVGPRAAYVVPFVNRIGYFNSPALYYAPGPYGADRDVINSSYWKLTASAKISF